MRMMIPTLFMAVLLAGCATAPQTPQLPLVELKSGDRIGILVESGNSPSHSHVGYFSRGRFPTFPDFDRQYSYNWNLQSTVTGIVSDSLRGSGFTVVDLRKEGYGYEDLADLVIQTSNEWKVSESKGSVFLSLREQSGVRAVVLVKESPVIVLTECPGGISPCIERHMSTSGLYTRTMYGLTNYQAVAAFTWNVFVLDPVVDLAKGPAVSKALRTPAAVIRDFAKPANFENITEAEFEPVRGAAMKIVGNEASVVAAALKNVNPNK